MCAGLVTYCSCGRFLPPAEPPPAAITAAGASTQPSDQGEISEEMKKGQRSQLMALIFVCFSLVFFTIGCLLRARLYICNPSPSIYPCSGVYFRTHELVRSRYEQEGNTIQLFFDDHVDRSVDFIGPGWRNIHTTICRCLWFFGIYCARICRCL